MANLKLFSFILKPFKYATFRVPFLSVLGATLALYLIHSSPNHDSRLLTSAQHHESKYPFFDFADSKDEFQPQVVVNPMPPITEFPVVSMEAANETLHEAELVLGVTISGESRAYPINTLTGPEREIINDQLGGRAIAATW